MTLSLLPSTATGQDMTAQDVLRADRVEPDFRIVSWPVKPTMLASHRGVRQVIDRDRG